MSVNQLVHRHSNLNNLNVFSSYMRTSGFYSQEQQTETVVRIKSGPQSY